MKDVDAYQVMADETAIFANAFYPKVSLIVEAAELVDLFVKRDLRGDPKVPSRKEIISEAGDVMWNLAVMMSQQGINMSEVLQFNINKLQDRAARGVLQGNGGDR